MDSRTEKEFRAHAEREYPREACGLVLVVKGREVYFPCRNIARSPEDHFVMSPEDRAAAEDRGEIIAVCHSHPDASPLPSAADKVQCEITGVPWHVVSVSIPSGSEQPVAGAIRTHIPCGYEAPLIGRPFEHGTHDCYGLVRDYYKREMGVELPDYEREFGWWDRGQNLYEDHVRECGFEIVTDDPQVGDLFLMQIRSPVINHAAIYIGDGMILHHVINRLSSRDVYGGYWREVTRYRIRKVK